MKKVKEKLNNRKVHKIDAKGQVLGRLATEVASLLRGKHKVNFVPNLDVGDTIVVYNIEKIEVTGRKKDQKIYWRHSQYPGGLKKEYLGKLLQKNPQKVMLSAVKGMLPQNRLTKSWLSHLKILKGEINDKD